MVGVVFWLVGVAITVLFSIFIHVTPALFQICIFFERLIFAGVQRTTQRPLSIGELTLASSLVWGVGAALVGLVFLAGIVGQVTSAVAVGSIGLIWGLSVGYQAAVQEVAHQLRQPGALEYHHPGSLVSRSHEGQPMDPDLRPRDDMWLEGIFLGEAREQRRRR